MIRKLLSQTAIYGLSATTAKFLNYLLTPFLTRVLSDAVYGEASYLYSIIPFANVLLTLGFSTAYFRFATDAGSIGEQKKLFSTLWGTVSIFALIFSFIGALLFPSRVTMLMFGLIFVDNVAAIPLSLLRQQGRALYYTMVNVSGVVVNVVLCFVFYLYIDQAIESPAYMLLANLLGSLVTLLLLLPAAIKMFVGRIDTLLLKKVALYSLPLMLSGVMGIASDFIDRQMLRWILPESTALAQLGVYSAVARIAALLIIFRQIYSLGAEPFFLQKFSRDDFARYNAAALKYFLVTGIALCLVIILFSDIFALIVGSDFRSAMHIVPILLAANLLSGVLINLSFWYKIVDKTRYAIIVTLSGITVTVALNFLLIPLIGYSGAAWARIAGGLTMVVMSYLLGQKYFRVEYNVGLLGLYVGLGLLIVAAGYWTATLDNVLRWALNALMVVGYVAFFIRKEGFLSLIKRGKV